jgi:hypothetical protein
LKLGTSSLEINYSTFQKVHADFGCMKISNLIALVAQTSISL